MTPSALPLFLALALHAQLPSQEAATAGQPDAPHSPPAVPQLSSQPRLQRFVFKLAQVETEEQERLERYLSDLQGLPLTAAVLAQAEQRLGQLRRYERARCHPELDTAICDIWRARVLREVRVEGLPAAILESDLRKRVFLRPGEPLDDENATSGKSRLVRQRNRIEDFLEDEGFHAAEVRLLVKKVDDVGGRDVIIRVRGGAFVEVRRVDLRSFGPLSQRQLQNAFGAMCLTSEGLLDGVAMGNLTSCFNRRRLQATVERFVDELHELGYPEARVRAEPIFIAPDASTDPACALPLASLQRYRDQGLPAPPRCVDLAVTVAEGTRVVSRFHAPGEERRIVELPLLAGTALWLRETFLEPSSRLIQLATDAPPASAADTDLVELRMREALTFQESRTADEVEVEVSSRNVEKYLASRGRVAPRVLVESRDEPGERIVDFTAAPTAIAAIRTVRFVGNRSLSAKTILEELELAAHPRSLTHSGAYSAEQLADDEARIVRLYADHGHPEAIVTGTSALDEDGGIAVVFTIDEGEPFVLADLLLEGGAPELTPDVLSAIRHCQGGVASEERRAPLTPADCRGAPLLPEELEADAQRVAGVYAEHGFPHVEATLETAFSPAGPMVRVSVVPSDASAEERAHPRAGNVKQVRLGEVFLEGNRRTRPEVLLREAGLEGGTNEPLDPIALGKGISRLRRSGLYDSVELQYIGLDDESGRAHVRLAVSERPVLTFDTSVGFSSQQLASLRNELRHRNLFGTMLDASWLLDFGLFVGRFSQTRVQLRWPRILGTDITASFVPLAMSYTDVPAGIRIDVPSTPAGQKAAAAWAAPDLRRRLLLVGGSLGLDWRARDIAPFVDDKLTLGIAVELRYDWLDAAGEPYPLFGEKAFRTLDGILSVLESEVARVATLTPRVAYNSVDNPFDPRDGFGFEAFFRGSSPPFVDQGPYGVLGFSGRGYKSFLDRFTLAAGGRARLGFAAPSDDCETPGCEWALMQNDLLLLGGERSVRGVDENSIGVLGPAYNQQLEPVLQDGAGIVQPHPGFYGASVSIELRYTLVRQLFLGDLRPAVFTDIGVSTDDLSFGALPTGQAVDTRYAVGIGAGLRYVLPVGPLSLDVAWSPTRNTTAAYVLFGYIF